MNESLNMSGKRILILGASRGQVGLIKAAKAIGCYVIVASTPGNYPGFDDADEVLRIDILDKEALLDKARKLNLDAVASSCMDTGIETLGYLVDNLDLKGPSLAAAKLCSDKHLMKDALMAASVPTAQCILINSSDDLSKSIEQLGFPVVIKATDLQGSDGVYICRTAQEANRAYEQVMGKTRQHYCLAEEFIDGYEFGAQAMVQNGKVLFVLPHGDDVFSGNTSVPIGHYVPLALSDEAKIKVNKCIVSAIEAIGIDNAAVNVDLFMKQGEPYIIELTCRAGANCLVDITSAYFSIDYNTAIVLNSLGIPINYDFTLKASESTTVMSKMITSSQSGTVKAINWPDEKLSSIIDRRLFISPGSIVNAFTCSKDCIGQIVVKDRTLDICQNIIDQEISKLAVTYE